MRKIFILIGITICANILSAQVVTTKPVVPTLSKAIEVTFDASKGTRGLMGYAGAVYVHTGVITNKSTGDNDWKHVVTKWEEDDSKFQLTNIGEDLWRFTISPNIRSFYGVPNDEQVLKLAFVFRSSKIEGASHLEGKGEGGEDILIDVSEDDFNLIMLSPKGNTVYAPGSSISISAAASEICKLSLFSNETPLKELAADTLIEYVMSSAPTGEYSIVAVAELGGKVKADTVNVVVRAQTKLVSRPTFVQDYDGIYYHPNDNTKMTLVLCAPQKDHVFVWGDFTDWKMSNEYQMMRDNDRFWITIENLTPGLEYAFQYVVDDSIYIADPYSEKVLDSWNDPYIPVSAYPNLKPFPKAKAKEGYASVIETGQKPYNWVVKNFAAPRNEDLVIYELLLRDFLKAHDYATLMDTLTYLQRLGINAIELLPINEFDGNESWGYNSAYYCSPDKYYGSAKSLKRFIDECHRRGIAVILDIALNHSFGNSPTAKMYWDGSANKPMANSPYHNRDPKHPFNVGEDFNHD
ncbi:MAG: Por secretion system protein, partial [Prevotellaceae bacterium]|nr:Por secretion system protein [Prevotellaceae bacterium]